MKAKKKNENKSGCEVREGQLSLRDMQLEELKLLDSFCDFCQRHGLRFFVYAGTLLGAARHRGFIPWDDDVDVAMPRPDYRTLASMADVFFQETGYKLAGSWPLGPVDGVYCKVQNPSIRTSAPGYDSEDFLFIDVFPIDGMPDNQQEAKKHCEKANVRRLDYVAKTTPIKASNGAARKLVKVLFRMKNLFSSPETLAHRLSDFADRFPYGASKHAGLLVWTPYGEGERAPIESFECLTEIEFEGSMYPCISNWEAHLSKKYGDYMTLPPESERAAHSLIAWRI